MIRSLIAAVALSTLCIPQVEATEVFTETDLLEYHEELGGRVYVDSALCEETGALGLQQGVTVHICTEPHEGDMAEMADTISRTAGSLSGDDTTTDNHGRRGAARRGAQPGLGDRQTNHDHLCGRLAAGTGAAGPI